MKKANAAQKLNYYDMLYYTYEQPNSICILHL